MVRYRKRAGKKLLDDPLNRWMAWLDKKSPPGLIAEVLKMDGAIKAANERLDSVTMDKEFLRYYHLRQMALSDYNSEMNYAREEGLAEGLEHGLEKGRQEGIYEIARKMKNAGRPLSEIVEFTGLSAETIEKM